MLGHQYVSNPNFKRFLCCTKKPLVSAQSSSYVNQVHGISVTQSYRESILASRSNNANISLAQPCFFFSSLYINTARKPVSKIGATRYYATLMSPHCSLNGANTNVQVFSGQQNRQLFSTKFESTNPQEVFSSLSEQLDEILNSETQKSESLNNQKLLDFIGSSSIELSVLAGKNKNISYEIFSFVGQKVLAILNYVSAKINKNTLNSKNSIEELSQKAFICQIVNALLTKYLEFNFSISNQCLQLVHVNSSLAKFNKTGINEAQGLSIEAMASILRYNPERVKSCWEFFLDFVTQYDLLKLIKENELLSNDVSKEEVSNLMNTLVSKLLCDHNAGDAGLVNEAKPLSIKQLANIIFVILNFEFKVSETNKTNLLNEFSRANIGSVLFLPGLNIEKICTPKDISMFLNRSITDSYFSKGYENDEYLYSKKADIVKALRLLKYNDEPLLNESLTLLGKDYISALDGLLNLLSEIRNPANQPGECKKEAATVAEINVNLRGIGNYLAPTSNEFVLSLKTYANQPQLDESELVHRIAEDQLRYVINNLNNIFGSSNSEVPREAISTEKLCNNVLLYLALDLDDFEAASANFHQLISQQHFNHDKVRFTMLKICAIKALESQKEVPWIGIAETMIPGCVNTFTANIDILLSNPAGVQSALVKEEIADVVRVVKALILLYGGFDMDRSIDLFNMNVENFKRLDSIQNNIVASGVNESSGVHQQQDSLTEHLYCYFLVDCLIKATLWNNQRELAYVIYDKSVENGLVMKNYELAALKKNFKKFGEQLEDAELDLRANAKKCETGNSKFKQFVIQYMRSI